MELVLPTSSIHILTKTKLTTKKTNLFLFLLTFHFYLILMGCCKNTDFIWIFQIFLGGIRLKYVIFL